MELLECETCGKLDAECTCYNDDAQPKFVKADNKVKNPTSTHYNLWQGTDAIDVIKEMLTPMEYRGFLKGNILKYQLRLGKKDATDKEIIKIKDYQRELEGLLNE